MCYNCGCGMPDNDMGKGHAAVDPAGKAITNQTFQTVAAAFGMNEEKAKEETLKLLQKETEEK